MTLPVARLVQVGVKLAQAGAQGRNFNNPLMLGDSNVINGLQRMQTFSSSSGVAQAFGANAPEAIAAALFFSQSPQPQSLTIGRWLRTATAGAVLGAILSASQTALGLFTAITSGGMTLTIDGVVKNLTGMDFSAQTNLNGVATVVTTALAGAGVCTWNGTEFIINSSTTGAGRQASGTITFTGNPLNNDTVTINGIVITFVTAGPTGNQVLIGGTAAQTAVNLNTFLTNSVNANLLLMTYAVNVGTAVVTCTAVSVGTAGNTLTLVKSSANITLSGATLTGGLNASAVSYATAPGAGQDVSTLMGLTAALALPLVPGYNAETPLQAVVACDLLSTQWYGLGFAASVMPQDSDNLAIAAYVEGDAVTRFFGVTTQNANCKSPLVTNDYGSLLQALGYLQSWCMFSSSTPYAHWSVFGLMTVNFAGSGTMIDFMYKQLPGVVSESLLTADANTLQAKHINVYAGYDNATSIFQYGQVAGAAFMDEIYGLDAMQGALITAEFNVSYTSPTKIPQTDQGNSRFTNAAANICEQFVGNGFGAPGVWNGQAFGQLQQGQFMKAGYYIFQPSVASQSQADIAARKTPPIQIAFKLAGANDVVVMSLTASR